MQLIGITGRAGAGKDTICTIAREFLLIENKRVEIIGCATPLKRICADVFHTALNVPLISFYGTQEEKEKEIENIPGWSGRKILQHIGTEGFRAVHSHIWAAYLLGSATSFFKAGVDVVLVNDVRFPEEAEAIQSFGGLVVRVYRNLADSTTPTHVSERDLDNIKPDYIIDNHERSLYCLRDLVQGFLWHHKLISSPSTLRPRA